MKNNKGILKSLRKEILFRNEYTCQKCFLEDKTGNKLEIHHIMPKFNEGSDEKTNLITLCRICHRYAPNNIKEFDEYMSSELNGFAEILIKAWKKFLSKTFNQ